MYIMDCVAGGHSLGRTLGIRTRTHVNTRRTFLSCNCKKIAKKHCPSPVNRVFVLNSI